MWSSVVSVHQSPRAAIYRNIGELEQGWTWEQSDLFIFSDCNFAFWASTGDLPCKQLPVELKSQSLAVGVINSLLSLCWTQTVTYLTHLPPYLKIVLKIASAWRKAVQKRFKQIFVQQLLLKSVFPPTPHPSPLPPKKKSWLGLSLACMVHARWSLIAGT